MTHKIVLEVALMRVAIKIKPEVFTETVVLVMRSTGWGDLGCFGFVVEGGGGEDLEFAVVGGTEDGDGVVQRANVEDPTPRSKGIVRCRIDAT